MSKVKKIKPNVFNKKSSVAVVVYDASGAPIQDSIADEIADSITAIAKRENYIVSVTKA